MYNEEYDDEEDVKTSDNFLVNFYYNNKILVWILIGVLLLVLFLSLVTKGTGGSKKDTSYEVEIVSPEEESVTISIGHTYTMYASIKNKPNAVFKWSVEDEKIAKVDNGTVTGLDYGKTKVYATYIDDDKKEHQASKEVIVADGDPDTKLISVSYKPGDLFMPVGATYKIALTLNPPRGYVENESFSSSNTAVVQVDNTGLVTAVGEGEATISFDVNNGFFKNTLKVYVSNTYTKTEIIVTPEKIEFDGESRKIKVGASERLTYTVTPETADKTKLEWKSSNTEIATVDENGIVKGLKEGSTIVTVTAINGASDKIDVEVGNDIIEVTDINLSTTDVSMNVGQSQTIIPTVVPDNASNKALSFESLDTSIATVSGNGMGTSVAITGIGAGYTTVVVRSTNGIEKRINVSVNGNGEVNPPSDNPGGGGSSNWSGRGYKITSKDSSGKTEGWITSAYHEFGADNKATPPVTITVTKTDSNISRVNIKYCTYGTTCDPKTYPTVSVQSSGTFTINNSGDYIIKAVEYDSNGTVVRTSDSYIIVGTGSSTTCTAGQYYDTSVNKCLTCPAGYSKSAAGSIGKDKCYRTVPAGKSLTWTGSDTPIERDCDDGYYSVERKVFYGHGDSCTKCTSGVSNPNHTGCVSSSTSCSAGEWLNGSSCEPCPKGFRCSSNSKTACTGRTYQDLTGQSTCKTCSGTAGTPVNGGNTTCTSSSSRTDPTVSVDRESLTLSEGGTATYNIKTAQKGTFRTTLPSCLSFTQSGFATMKVDDVGYKLNKDLGIKVKGNFTCSSVKINITFTPEDTSRYNTVSKSITVNVRPVR